MQYKKIIASTVLSTTMLFMASAGAVVAQTPPPAGTTPPPSGAVQGMQGPRPSINLGAMGGEGGDHEGKGRDGQGAGMGQKNSNSGTKGKNHFGGPMHKGEKSADITALQQVLIAKGLLPATTTATGFFGATTQNAVHKLQTQNGITNTDGSTVGPQTQNLLESIIAQLGGTIPTDPASVAQNGDNQNAQGGEDNNGDHQGPRPRPCPPGALFDSMTGQSCPTPKPVVSCAPGEKYDALTGKMCAVQTPVPTPATN